MRSFGEAFSAALRPVAARRMDFLVYLAECCSTYLLTARRITSAADSLSAQPSRPPRPVRNAAGRTDVVGVFPRIGGNFGQPDIFAVPQGPLRAGRNAMGMVDTGLLPQAVEGRRVLLLGRRSRLVAHIGWKRRSVYVEALDGYRAARFGRGSRRRVHRRAGYTRRLAMVDLDGRQREPDADARGVGGRSRDGAAADRCRVDPAAADLTVVAITSGWQRSVRAAIDSCPPSTRARSRG